MLQLGASAMRQTECARLLLQLVAPRAVTVMRHLENN